MSYNDLRKGRFSQLGAAYHVVIRAKRGTSPFSFPPAAATVMRHLYSEAAVKTLTICLMPDHLHWLFTLHTTELSRVVGSMKGRTARLLKTSGLWQPAYYDHQVRKSETLATVAKYILQNPVSAKLCNDLREYPYWFCALPDVVCPNTGQVL